MFKIRGSDGREFGPVIPTVVRQWIANGKANAETLVQKVGESEWKPLSSFAEFSQDLPRSTQDGADSGPPPTRAPAPVLPQRTSRMAIASLVLGLLGFLIIPGIIGMILGIIAQTRISYGSGRLNGRGWAIAGMVSSGLMLLLGLSFWSALLLPTLAEKRAQAAEGACLERVSKLTQALLAYANRHDGVFPPAATWCDALLSEGLIEDDIDSFVCPSISRLRSGYALNELLGEKKKSDVFPRTVLIFECSKGWNGVGGPYDLASSRHRSGMMTGFVDGSVEAIPGWQIPQLKWTP